MVEIDFGTNLKNARIKSRIPQNVAADYLGVVASFLSQLENNKKRPNVELIYKASHLYGVDAGYFFTNHNGLADLNINENQTINIDIEDLLKDDVQQKYNLRLDGMDITDTDLISVIAFLKVLRTLNGE